MDGCCVRGEADERAGRVEGYKKTKMGLGPAQSAKSANRRTRYRFIVLSRAGGFFVVSPPAILPRTVRYVGGGQDEQRRGVSVYVCV